jgi:hypothetical protein
MMTPQEDGMSPDEPSRETASTKGYARRKHFMADFNAGKAPVPKEAKVAPGLVKTQSAKVSPFVSKPFAAASGASGSETATSKTPLRNARVAPADDADGMVRSSQDKC